MLSKIAQASGTYPLGVPPSRRLLRIDTGQYRGRKVVLFQASASEIRLSSADSPYVSWSSPVTAAADAADQPFDAVMDGEGNIQLVYTEAAANDLVTRKLNFVGGAWAPGPLVTVCNAYESFYPSVAIEPGGKLWVTFSRYAGGTYNLYAKSSNDDGATWGGGPSDSGDLLHSGASALCSRLVVSGVCLYVFYSHSNATLAVRMRLIAGSTWDPAVALATATGTMDQHFDAAASAGGLVGVVYDQDELRYREYDGANWSSAVVLDSDAAFWPQLLFVGNVPVVTYLSEVGAAQFLMKQTNRKTGVFASPSILDPAARPFDSVLLYDMGSFSWTEVTGAAASVATADVYHPRSGAMVAVVGDCVCLGMSSPFRYVKLLLSTAGVGGIVTYAYWDGDSWIAFTPVGGNFNLNATDTDLLLWNDYDSIPADWQKAAVSGQIPRYWVRLQVNASFTTPPVGSRITAISDLRAFSVRR